jgi:hypothetical protein
MILRSMAVSNLDGEKYKNTLQRIRFRWESVMSSLCTGILVKGQNLQDYIMNNLTSEIFLAQKNEAMSIYIPHRPTLAFLR